MKTKLQFSLLNPTHIIFSFILLLLLLFFSLLFLSNTQSKPPQTQTLTQCACPSDPGTPSCTESSSSSSSSSSPSSTTTPPSLAKSLIHYATSNITPQQTFDEIMVTERVLRRKVASAAPSRFLVFGLGHDSLMWAGLNYGGRTVFLEEDKNWIGLIKGRFQELEVYHVVYDQGKVREAEGLLRRAEEAAECRDVVDPRLSKCILALKGLPNEVYDVEWDLIMVDAPTGYHDEAPGRMSAIYTAGLMARNRADGETDVFVHDVDRPVEDKFSKAFLCQGYMIEQEGRLRHFTIPSHRAQTDRPFCPSISS